MVLAELAVRILLAPRIVKEITVTGKIIIESDTSYNFPCSHLVLRHSDTFSTMFYCFFDASRPHTHTLPLVFQKPKFRAMYLSAFFHCIEAVLHLRCQYHHPIHLHCDTNAVCAFTSFVFIDSLSITGAFYIYIISLQSHSSNISSTSMFVF